jgi:hypothetical protein
VGLFEALCVRGARGRGIEQDFGLDSWMMMQD